MAYNKTNWTSTTPINTTNLNNIENGIEANDTALTENLENINENLDKKLDKTSVKTAKTTSGTDTYSCNYINGITRINGAYLLGFSGKSSLKVYSSAGYGIFMIAGSTFMSIVQLVGPNGTPSIKDIYGTHPFTASVSGNNVTLSSLNTWDHHILMGSNEIINVEEM